MSVSASEFIEYRETGKRSPAHIFIVGEQRSVCMMASTLHPDSTIIPTRMVEDDAYRVHVCSTCLIWLNGYETGS
jgi:hypothetical protein